MVYTFTQNGDHTHKLTVSQFLGIQSQAQGHSNLV